MRAGWMRLISAMKGAQNATDTGTAPAQTARPISLLQIAPTLPARVIRLPPPSVGISPAARQTAPDKTFKSGWDEPHA
jgi:hypothetical protein